MDLSHSEDSYNMDTNQSEDSYIMFKTQTDNYENRPFECALCGNRFNRNAHLKSHLAVHTGERPYTCDECGDKFKQSSALKTHMLIHTGDRPYVCKECNKSFRTSSTLKKHSLLHTGEKPHSCDICGKSFNQTGALKSHRFTHRPVSERPFHCTQCNQGFVNKSTYRIHLHKCGGKHRNYNHFPPLDENLFIESGVKQYECSFCKKMFYCKTRLRIHLRTHTGERPYRCKVCDRAFAQSGDVKIHSYVHTGERPHKCTMCDKGYTNKGTLNQHMKTHEKRVETPTKSMKSCRKKQVKSNSKKSSLTHRLKLGLTTKSKGQNSRNVNLNINYVGLSSVSEVYQSEESGDETKNIPEFEEKNNIGVAPDIEEKQKDSLSLDAIKIKNELDSGPEMDCEGNLEQATKVIKLEPDSILEMSKDGNLG